ncbi:FISUMP domain-containing protein [Owenweeksia hongkongensis]|uniref:FISUMP domain-containing protein n=1 Tax=Owenweeksia hongkongensis TaxID=253245 RepID=UPI003A958319
MPPPEDQGSEGSCVAFAVGYAARSYHHYRDNHSSYQRDEVFSPEFLYNSAKFKGSCAKAGMSIREALRFVQKEGIDTWQGMPYSHRNGCTTLPTPEQLANAECHKIVTYGKWPYASVNDFKFVLEKKFPLMIGVNLDRNFQRAGLKDFIWSEKTSGGGKAGGHALVISGWDDGRNAWKVMNSWGVGWGDPAEPGFGWIDYEYLSKVLIEDAFVMITKPQNCKDCDGLKTITDIDGNVYPVVKIGKQCWMKKNLSTSSYNDGTPIISAVDSTTWFIAANNQMGAYRVYENNPNNNLVYGKLYNGHAANSRKLCPQGWHIPDGSDLNTLQDFLGGRLAAGKTMKSINYWLPSTGISNSNSSGFSGLPGGWVIPNGLGSNGWQLEHHLGQTGFWWGDTVTFNSPHKSNYHFRLSHYNDEMVYIAGGFDPFYGTGVFGLSCRCIKD